MTAHARIHPHPQIIPRHAARSNGRAPQCRVHDRPSAAGVSGVSNPCLLRRLQKNGCLGRLAAVGHGTGWKPVIRRSEPAADIGAGRRWTERASEAAPRDGCALDQSLVAALMRSSPSAPGTGGLLLIVCTNLSSSLRQITPPVGAGGEEEGVIFPGRFRFSRCIDGMNTIGEPQRVAESCPRYRSRSGSPPKRLEELPPSARRAATNWRDCCRWPGVAASHSSRFPSAVATGSMAGSCPL